MAQAIREQLDLNLFLQLVFCYVLSNTGIHKGYLFYLNIYYHNFKQISPSENLFFEASIMAELGDPINHKPH